jgi:hypothetical protein
MSQVAEYFEFPFQKMDALPRFGKQLVFRFFVHGA